MRQLFPESRTVDAAEVYDDPRRLQPRDRPYVFVNMVASADGGTVVDGTTEHLGGPADRHVFLLLRSLADAILAGAQTVRAEGYGPAVIRPEFAEARRRRGQPPMPRVAVVSRSLKLDWSGPLFTDGRTRPFVLAPATADASSLHAAREVAEVVAVGDGELDLRSALQALADQGVRSLLCEGGPTLNAALLEAGLVDELCLTVTPQLLGRTGGRRITGDAGLSAPADMELVHVLEEQGYLFLRYLLPEAS